MRKKRGQRVHDFVMNEIGMKIVSGKWAVGALLPTDAELCESLRVSRTALREALMKLAVKGLVKARQKAGTVVRPKEDWNMIDRDLLMWRVEAPEGTHVLRELYDLRRLIEPLAASLAAVHATRPDIERLRKAFEDMVEAGDDGEKVFDPDMRFHRAVISASGNSLFASVGLIIASALEVNFEVVKDTPRGHAWSLPLHKAVLDAISARESKAARVAMQKLLDESEADLLSARADKAKWRRVRSRLS